MWIGRWVGILKSRKRVESLENEGNEFRDRKVVFGFGYPAVERIELGKWVGKLLRFQRWIGID